MDAQLTLADVTVAAAIAAGLVALWRVWRAVRASENEGEIQL